MTIRYPDPLAPGDRIGVTAPSSGVAPPLRERLEVSVRALRDQGFDVVVGACMDGLGHVSAPARERAAELTAMLVDPTIRAVVPPWGGETAIDLLDLLDWDAIARARPTWMVGFSDISTLITPLTLRTGVATVHGQNLMDTPYTVPPPLVSWLDVVQAPSGSSIDQGPAPAYRAEGFDDYATHPTVDTFTLDTPGTWTRFDGEDEVTVSGRLVGGCIETLSNLVGTPFGDVPAFARDHAPEGLVVYLEAAEAPSFDIARRLHGMRLAGWFDQAHGVLVARTRAPGAPSLSQREAVMDALGGLGLPIVGDVECGHVPPHLALVNGALATVSWSIDGGAVRQTLA
ncbi:S66 peptidase family protein [Actinotalea sp. K2]|uniref:S66 family peptidase n=1 Tax=Actinotalea sp. K2 TaxID=2939438 RepID=UPI0020174C10|nr:S66 peptidase family protein [Actinotalea sp. K2]MCL3860514.1 LD-carboxypeptidase [Actinotalea sp. K2]